MTTYVIKKETDTRRLYIYVGLVKLRRMGIFYSAYKKTFWTMYYISNTISSSMEECERKLMKALELEDITGKIIKIVKIIDVI